ncbi:MAG TPA: hypothetical protein VM658_14630 [bacterium]|nr:hypothetical protein [bacterium]
MTWQTIAASETDANSPLNQTLMDKIREDLDYLYATGAQMKFINGSFSNNATAADFTLDSSMSWMDRYVQVVGDVTIYSATSNFLPGGADDDELGSRYTAINGVTMVGQLDGWIYTRSGGASRITNPYIYAEWNGTNDKAYIWVDSAGNLKLGFSTSRASGSRNVAFNLRIVYSEDQGAY